MVMNIVDQLKENGYHQVTVDDPIIKGKFSHLVYLVDDKYAYFQSSRRPDYLLTKVKRYLKRGCINNLPTTFKTHFADELSRTLKLDLRPRVEIFYNPTKFLDFETQIAVLKKYKDMGRKPRDKTSERTVYLLGIEGEPEFKLISSKGSIDHVISVFVSATKDVARTTHKKQNEQYRTWAKKHLDKITTANVTCEILDKGSIENCKYFIQGYLDRMIAYGDKHLILNRYPY